MQQVLEKVLKCNRVAMEELGRNNFQHCATLLQDSVEALKQLESDPDLPHYEKYQSSASLTFNNLGCYYKK